MDDKQAIKEWKDRVVDSTAELLKKRLDLYINTAGNDKKLVMQMMQFDSGMLKALHELESVFHD